MGIAATRRPVESKCTFTACVDTGRCKACELGGMRLNECRIHFREQRNFRAGCSPRCAIPSPIIYSPGG